MSECVMVGAVGTLRGISNLESEMQLFRITYTNMPLYPTNVSRKYLSFIFQFGSDSLFKTHITTTLY